MSRLLLAFLPHKFNDSDIIEYLHQVLQNKETLIEILKTKKKLFTNFRIFRFSGQSSEQTVQHLSKLQTLKYNDKYIYCQNFQGNNSFVEFEEKFSSFCVHISGIPLKKSFNQLHAMVTENTNPRDVFIPKKLGWKNCYFGFVTFWTIEEKEALLSIRKVKGHKITLQFKDYADYRAKVHQKQQDMIKNQPGGSKKQAINHNFATKKSEKKNQEFGHFEKRVQRQNPEVGWNWQTHHLNIISQASIMRRSVDANHNPNNLRFLTNQELFRNNKDRKFQLT